MSADLVREVARLYATTKRAAVDSGNGLETPHQQAIPHGRLPSWLPSPAISTGLGGMLCRWGAQCPCRRASISESGTRRNGSITRRPGIPETVSAVPGGTSSAYFRTIESVLTEKPYPVRTIMAPGTQPTVSTRGSKRVVEALRKLDFFVVIDVMRTAEMAFADVVVPVATPYETDHPFEFTPNWIMARNKVVEPRANTNPCTSSGSTWGLEWATAPTSGTAAWKSA